MINFFLLGRNPELSRYELLSYLESRKITFKEILYENNYILLESNFKFNIEDFGGIICLGDIIFNGNNNTFESFLNSINLVDEDKFNYSIIGNVDIDYLKDYFKRNKQKAILKHGRKKLKFQDGSFDIMPSSKNLFFLYEYKDNLFFGKVSQMFNSKEIEYRDMNKPIRREELAISPRLSKILINLSGAKENDLLLDPFCGVGGILQEALLKKINVHGSDNDMKAVYNCKKNLNWIVEKYNIKSRYNVIKNDAKFLSVNKFDAIASESPLGDIVNKKLDDKRSKIFISKFENYIIPMLVSMRKSKKKGAKIAITFPFIRENKVNIEKICSESGLEVVISPIKEIKEKQFIGRDIIVFK